MPGVVDKNIAEARNKYSELSKPMGFAGEPGERAATSGGLIVRTATWFESKVKDQGPWDYKYVDPKYQALGNFNYGATGSALGFTLGQLQRVAGWYQQYGPNGDKASGRGTPPLDRLDAFAGVGGTYPYGDEPVDALWIAEGVKYYECIMRSH